MNSLKKLNFPIRIRFFGGPIGNWNLASNWHEFSNWTAKFQLELELDWNLVGLAKFGLDWIGSWLEKSNFFCQLCSPDKRRFRSFCAGQTNKMRY